MKTRKIYVAVIMVVAGMATVVSCQKDETSAELSKETTETVNETAATEMAEEEIFTSVEDAVSYTEREGSGLKSASIATQCATISVKPLIGGYPKTITIDFGSNCTGSHGISRSGSISFTISDSLRTPGAVLNVSFSNFAVNGFSVSGTMSFENTGTGTVHAFSQETDLTMTKSDGTVVTKTKTADREWIAGSETDDISDDIFQITGNADVRSSARGSYSYTITEPLVITASCDMISEGVIEYTTSESTEPLTIDFGDGECDLKVRISERNIADKEINLTK